MDKFELKEMKKKRPIKNISYDWLIYYIPEPIRKNVGDFRDKVVNLFKAVHLQKLYGRGKKLSIQKTQKQSEEKKKEIIVRIIQGDHRGWKSWKIGLF